MKGYESCARSTLSESFFFKENSHRWYTSPRGNVVCSPWIQGCVLSDPSAKSMDSSQGSVQYLMYSLWLQRDVSRTEGSGIECSSCDAERRNLVPVAAWLAVQCRAEQGRALTMQHVNHTSTMLFEQSGLHLHKTTHPSRIATPHLVFHILHLPSPLCIVPSTAEMRPCSLHPTLPHLRSSAFRPVAPPLPHGQCISTTRVVEFLRGERVS